MTVCRTQCSSTTVTLCLAPFFVWIWLVRYLSRPRQRGRSVVVSKRNFATVLLTATQSSYPLCSQTETSSLSVMNVSVARVFFKPSVIGKETSGVHDTSSQNVMSYDVYIRVNLHANVVLPSGTTMFQEILTSMIKELTVLPPPSMRSMWLLPPERQYLVWIERSILSSLNFSACVDLEGAGRVQ